MAVHDDRAIAQWILRKGWLDQETLQNYLEEAKARPGHTLCHLLVEDELLTAEQALEATEEALRAVAPAAASPPRAPRAPHAGHTARGAGHPARANHAHAARHTHGPRPPMHRRPRPAWVLPVCIGGGLVVVVAGFLLLGGGSKTPSNEAKAPEAAGPIVPAETPAADPKSPDAPPAKPEEAAPAPAVSPAAAREQEALAELERIKSALADHLRIDCLRTLCAKFEGTQAAARAQAELRKLEAEYESRAGAAWQETLATAREKEGLQEFWAAHGACFEFLDRFPGTKASDAARAECRRLEEDRDARWAQAEAKLDSLIEARKYDEVRALVAEVVKWGWPDCARKAEERKRRATAKEREELAKAGEEEVAFAPPPEEGPGGEIAEAPESDPDPAPGGGGETPAPPAEGERKGSTKADPEGVAKKLGVTADELKSLFATEDVSLEGDDIVLKYEFSEGILGYGEINKELGRDFLPKIGADQRDVVRWSERAEGTIEKILHGIRVSETGRLEHKARWLADVQVTVLYMAGQVLRKQTTFIVGFRDEADPGRWIGANHGVQACIARAARNMNQGGAIRRAQPAAVSNFEWNRRYTLKMTLKGKTCTAALGERRAVEISDDDPFTKGRVGFLWWGTVVGTIGSIEIKGKLDPTWVREALGKDS
ncbi:MAG: hypothetical protein JXP34_26110 [Planctomycetes bacterium]|nr:hypothetical protein [Planctomycetota bacterium]